MAGFGQQQQWGANPSLGQQWAAQPHQQQLGSNQWGGWNQQNPNQQNAYFVQEHNSNMPMGQYGSWANQSQMDANQRNNEYNHWNQASGWSNAAPVMDMGPWTPHQQNQWAQQQGGLAGPAGFNGVTPSATSSTATAMPALSGSNLMLGNGTSGNLWEHANWPSSSYQLDAPQFAGMGR